MLRDYLTYYLHAWTRRHRPPLHHRYDRVAAQSARRGPLTHMPTAQPCTLQLFVRH